MVSIAIYSLDPRPTTASRERYLKAIEESERFPDVARLETFNTPRRALNITYLPLLAFPWARNFGSLGRRTLQRGSWMAA